MKKPVLILLLILVSASLPFTEGTSDRRSLDITSLTINFDKTDATFTVNYEFGRLSKLYILLLGSKSIEPKIKSVFSSFDYEIIKMDQDKTILRVKNISRLDNDKRYYLHDSVWFGETIRTIYIFTPDSGRSREYFNLNSTPDIFYRG